MYDMEEELVVNFLAEAEESVIETERLIMALESGKNKAAALTELFRVMHNLKGSAAAVGLSGLVQIAHAEESLLSKLSAGTVSLTPGLVTLLLRCNDHFSVCLAKIRISIDADTSHPALLSEVESLR